MIKCSICGEQVELRKENRYEVVIEADKGVSLDDICKRMSITPPWAKGLILNADGYECMFYKKEWGFYEYK